MPGKFLNDSKNVKFKFISILWSNRSKTFKNIMIFAFEREPMEEVTPGLWEWIPAKDGQQMVNSSRLGFTTAFDEKPIYCLIPVILEILPHINNPNQGNKHIRGHIEWISHKDARGPCICSFLAVSAIYCQGQSKQTLRRVFNLVKLAPANDVWSKWPKSQFEL